MMLAARETGILKLGDEILIPAVTWPTQAWAAIEAGFKVRLVDVDISTLQVNVGELDASITPRTKAIFLVHLMGSSCDMDAIQEIAGRHKLHIFEDCCEALGAKYDNRHCGTFGVASAFSFFQSHHITTMEGGMVCTDNPDFAETCRMIRAHGWARDLEDRGAVKAVQKYLGETDSRYLFLGMGFNFRPTELNAAFGLCQLPRLASFNAIRAKHADQVRRRFRATNGQAFSSLIPTSHKSEPAWFALPFVIREAVPYSRRDVMEYLGQYGIETRPLVGGNLARQPAFLRYKDITPRPLPNADAIHDRGLYIGLPPIETDMLDLIGTLNGMETNLRMLACP